jgi:hypothetical protein
MSQHKFIKKICNQSYNDFNDAINCIYFAMFNVIIREKNVCVMRSDPDHYDRIVDIVIRKNNDKTLTITPNCWG